MAGPLGTPTHFPGPPYLHPFRPAALSNANRFDEGYSEDTRSQNGSDMVMRTDAADVDFDSQLSLPDWVMALSESERSGPSTPPSLPPTSPY